MAQANGVGRVYSATYSNVPVYELNHNDDHVMRRRSDDWINATHILKSAGLDKPARTRILERDVQKNMHEKVQGGYGKYQGTWVPLSDGRELAGRYGVLPRLLPIFDYVAGDQSPPPAPKHTTAASNKPKVSRASAASKKAARSIPAPSMASDDQFSNMSAPLHDDNTPDNSTIGSTDYLDEDMMPGSTRSLKRKFEGEGEEEGRRQPLLNAVHTMYSDELLDYFLLRQTEDNTTPPKMPESFDPNRPVDDSGHTALHWAASVADLEVSRLLIERGGSINARSATGHTPLMRAIMFTNNFEQNTFAQMLSLLQDSINVTDRYGYTAFHHAVNLLQLKERTTMARFYMNCLINKVTEMAGPQGVAMLLNVQNEHGDTALHMAARANCRKMVRMLMKQDIDDNIRNKEGELAVDLVAVVLGYHPHNTNFGMSSSPQMLPYQGSSNIQNANVDQSNNSAADTMAQTIGPLITEKTGRLADALKAEIRAKNVRHKETLFMLVQARNQQAAARRDLYGYPENEEGPVMRQLQEGHLDELLIENGVLLEQYLHYHLKKDYPHPQDQIDLEQNPPSTASIEFQQKLDALRELADAEELKRKLIKDVVEATSQAGTSKKSAEYQKLLSLTISEPEDQLAKVMPGILEALEEADEAEALPDTPM